MTGFAESVDRRVLGGFVFVDAITNESIPSLLQVTSEQLRVKANHSGIYAVFNGPGFAPLTNQFIPSGTWPPPGNFEIAVSDPSLRYLARRAQIQAPQKLTGVVSPQAVRLYPGPAAIVEANWAVVRVSVTSSTGTELPWCFLQVIRADNSVAATGLSDARGEGLLAVVGLGLQVTSTATDPVTEATTPVTIKAWFDPSVLTQPAGWVPDPDDISGNLANPALKTGTFAGALGARQTLFAGITISV